MAKQRRPPPPSTQITEAHFRLLREFGRNPMQKRATDRHRKDLWRMGCQSAQMPYVPRDKVIEAWKKYVGGLSAHSGIAINGDVDPAYTTLGVTFRGLITSAHTTKTVSLLRRVMMIYAKTFDSRATFLAAAESLCGKVADKAWGVK